jgi:hypothetical protein
MSGGFIMSSLITTVALLILSNSPVAFTRSLSDEMLSGPVLSRYRVCRESRRGYRATRHETGGTSMKSPARRGLHPTWRQGKDLGLLARRTPVTSRALRPRSASWNPPEMG